MHHRNLKKKFDFTNFWNKLQIRYRRFQPKRAYDHVIPLGYNCEIAYQFFHLYHFLESSLFAWTYSYQLQDTINALNHFDQIGTHGFLPPSPLWECRNTKICFHGKDDPRLSFLELETELNDRIAHLKNKWLKIASSTNQSILYIVKIRWQSIEKNVNEITTLYNTLKKMTNAPFDLLVIRGKLTALPDLQNPHIFVRQVDHYAPDDDVPHKMAATRDWEKIFFEFGPKNYLEHRKHFKFEK